MDSLVYDAAANGDLSKLEQLTTRDPSVLLQVSRPKKESILHVAATSGNCSSVDFICTLCPELIEKRNSKGDSALHIAARAGHIKLLKLLMDKAKGVDLEAQVAKGDVPLHLEEHDFNRLKESDLNANNDNVGDTKKAPDQKIKQRDNIENRVGMELQRKNRRTALLKLQNKDGNTVLDEAVKRGDSNTFDLLVEEEPSLANNVNGSGETPLYLAAARGELKIVQKILQLGSRGRIATIKHNGRDGQAAIHVATARGHTEIAIELVTQMKELLKEKDNAGRTPLHYAAFFGSSTLSSKFIKLDSSCVYFRDKDGNSALHMAASKGHHKIVDQLTKSCSDAKDLLNRENQNVLHIAVKYGKLKVIKLLLGSPKYELILNDKDKQGNSALHLATRHWHPIIVSRFIFDKRVDKGVINEEGLTALDVAEKYLGTPTSFQKLATLAVLRAANAPSSQHRVVIMDDENKEEKEVTNKETILRTRGKALEDKKKSTTLEDKIYKDRAGTFIIVATLVVTVTFAAGFTMPGGYYSDGPNRGMAINVAKPFFYVCVICNTMALYTSIIITVILMWAQTSELNSLAVALKWCSPMLGFALMNMALAFATGTYTVVSKDTWFARTVLAAGIFFIVFLWLLFFVLHILLWSKNHRLLFVSRHLVRLITTLYWRLIFLESIGYFFKHRLDA